MSVFISLGLSRSYLNFQLLCSFGHLVLLSFELAFPGMKGSNADPDPTTKNIAGVYIMQNAMVGKMKRHFCLIVLTVLIVDITLNYVLQCTEPRYEIQSLITDIRSDTPLFADTILVTGWEVPDSVVDNVLASIILDFILAGSELFHRLRVIYRSINTT